MRHDCNDKEMEIEWIFGYGCAIHWLFIEEVKQNVAAVLFGVQLIIYSSYIDVTIYPSLSSMYSVPFTGVAE